VDGLGDDEDAEYYGQLLRRPGDLPAYPRQPGRPRARQPGRGAPPAAGYPAGGNAGAGYPPGGNPAGHPPNSSPAGYPGNGDPAGDHPGPGGYPPHGSTGNGGFLPNGSTGTGGPSNGGRASGGGYGGPVNAGPAPGRQYRLPYGRRVPPAADRLYRPPVPGSGGGTHRRGPGQDPLGGTWRRPARPSPAPGTPTGPGGTRAHGSASGSGPTGLAGTQAGGAGAWEQLRAPSAGRGVPISAETAASVGPAVPGGPVIRQRETAGSGGRPVGAAQSVASIAPDGVESFARDLRALRAKAELDYPEMAELSHYTMKTLASAAGGLRLPTFPVAVAYVRACGGNVAEWEDRWQKLAAKVADEAKKRGDDDDEQQAPPEPADAPAIPAPPARPAAQDPDPGPGEVYVITSARPRQPGWRGGLRVACVTGGSQGSGGSRGAGPSGVGSKAQWAACCRPTTTCTASGRGTRRPRRP
jgi:hypothetical protein